MSKIMHEPANILIVEDDHIDVEMLKRGLKKAGIANKVCHAETGVAALEVLRGQNNREKISYPFLMLVDINMPLMNGIEMLQELRNDKNLRSTIAFILTTSARKEDKAASYNLNVAGYFLKENLHQLISTLKPYCQGNQFSDPN